MSKWGLNFDKFDITAATSNLGSIIKNVEKSIDKAIGIPDEDGLDNNGSVNDNNNGNNSNTNTSFTDGSFFGYSFSSPTTPVKKQPVQQQQQQQQKTKEPSISTPIKNNSNITTTTTTSNDNSNISLLNLTPIKSKQSLNNSLISEETSPIKSSSTSPSKESNNSTPFKSIKAPEQPIFIKSSDSHSDDEDEDKPLYSVNEEDNQSQNESNKVVNESEKEEKVEEKEEKVEEIVQDQKAKENESSFIVNDKLVEDSIVLESFSSNNQINENVSVPDNDNLDIIDESINSQKEIEKEILLVQEQQEQVKQKEDELVNKESQKDEAVKLVVQPNEIKENIVKGQENNSDQKEINNSNNNQELNNKILELENKLNVLTIVNNEQKRILGEKEKMVSDLTINNSKIAKLNEQLLNDVNRLNTDSKKEDIENLKEEFSRRLGQLEKKLTAVTKERDSLKHGSQFSDSVQEIIKEKDEKINQILSEGTVLSQKISQLEQSAKKYKATLKENEETIKMLNDRISNTEQLLLVRSEKLKGYEESDKRYQDTINTMKEVTDTASKKLDQRDQEAEKAIRQATDLQAALEKSWKDISDLNKHHSIEIDRYTKQIEEERIRVKNECQMIFNQEKKDYQEKIEHLETVIQELRSSLIRNNEKASWKEDELNKEIKHLQQRCRDAEVRNDQLSSSIPQATRPLLKQIESIQSQFNERQLTWEALEKNLNQQIRDERLKAEQVLRDQQEIINELEELTIKFKLLETESKNDKKKLKSLTKDYEILLNSQQDDQQKIQDLESNIQQLNSSIQQYQVTISESELKISNLNKEIRDLDERKQREKEFYEKESLNFNKKYQQLLLQQSLQQSSSSSPLTQSNGSNSGINVSQELSNPLANSIGYNDKNSTPISTPSKQQSFYNSLKKTPSTHDFLNNSSFPASLEFLQASLSQKEGETLSLQAQVQSLDLSRKKLENELVKLTTYNEELLSECKDLKQQKQDIKDLETRYQTSLVLLGEKEEMVNELKMDIMDMKDLYKNQINELLVQIDSLKSNRN